MFIDGGIADMMGTPCKDEVVVLFEDGGDNVRGERFEVGEEGAIRLASILE